MECKRPCIHPVPVLFPSSRGKRWTTRAGLLLLHLHQLDIEKQVILLYNQYSIDEWNYIIWKKKIIYKDTIVIPIRFLKSIEITFYTF